MPLIHRLSEIELSFLIHTIFIVMLKNYLSF
jgi:hypothetical protein